jgi:chromosome segregation ATPase
MESLEGRVSKLEATVGEQARLRAAMDGDLGDMKAALGVHKDLLQSLHDTQQDHTKRLTRLETGQDKLHERLGAVEGRLGAVEGRLGAVESTLTIVHAGVDAIQGLLTRNIEQENPES